jgi:hypothetical protein
MTRPGWRVRLMRGAACEAVLRCAPGIDRSPSGASSLADEGIAVKSVLTKSLLDAARG